MHTAILDFISTFLFTIPIAVIGFVYSYILTMPGMIFNRWYRFLAEKAPTWLFYPLVHCEKCVCGQMALWLYPLVITGLSGCNYNAFWHLYFISQSILNVIILKAVYEALIEKQVPIPPPPINGFQQPLTPKNNG